MPAQSRDDGLQPPPHIQIKNTNFCAQVIYGYMIYPSAKTSDD